MFFLADDWGFQDAGFRVDTDLRDATPFVDQLAAEGVLLNQNYVSPVCSPTRAQYLTGQYALRLGFPTVVNANRRGTLDTSLPTIVERLSELGYAVSETTPLRCFGLTPVSSADLCWSQTAMVGKWHTGFESWAYTPISPMAIAQARSEPGRVLRPGRWCWCWCRRGIAYRHHLVSHQIV